MTGNPGPHSTPTAECVACGITLGRDEKIGTFMGDPAGFFCSDHACPIMGDKNSPTGGHEWSALWSHFGEYGDQDAHFHVCLYENPHPAPGYPADDCKALLVGKGRDCTDGQEHEVQLPKPRVRHG